MARDVTETLAQMLEGSRQVTWEASVVRGDDHLDNVPVALGGALSWDSGQQVELSGSVDLTLASDDGTSRAPRGAGDLLAPFGSEVMLSAVVALDDMVERVQVARARIVKVPNVEATRQRIAGQWVTLSEVISLDLRDRMDVLKADKYDAETPAVSTSAWTELEHLCPFPVVRSGPDAVLPAGLMHKGTKADAVQTVANRLGGVAAFDSAGNLIVRRASTQPVLTLTLGPWGTVAAIGSVMDTEGVYNRVVVRGEAPDGSRIQAVATATDALAPEVWGTRTYTADQGRFIATVQQAQGYADKLLAGMSNVQPVELEVQAVLDPRVELGDVVTVEWEGQSVPIRVGRISYGDPMMTVQGRRL